MRQPFAAPARGPQALPARDCFPSPRARPAVYRLPLDGSAETRPVGELGRTADLASVEAVLLAADEPLNLRRLATASGIDDSAETRKLVRQLQALYDRDGSAFQVEEIAGGFQLLSRPEFHPWLARMKRAVAETRLSAPMRETLAIIAYRQPIVRADVEAIRGVQCSEILRQLMEKGLIRIAGRDASLGRPVLYGTTKKFLQVFGLKNLRDLPEGEQLKAPPQSAED
ncbi:MAG: SMC-Scp complex subunit ScpB [Planctomycetia bacterium]|nr:SMC-Scp complex subunit ScpB [Planctomycetia bacterium]